LAGPLVPVPGWNIPLDKKKHTIIFFTGFKEPDLAAQGTRWETFLNSLCLLTGSWLERGGETLGWAFQQGFWEKGFSQSGPGFRGIW